MGTPGGGDGLGRLGANVKTTPRSTYMLYQDTYDTE